MVDSPKVETRLWPFFFFWHLPRLPILLFPTLSHVCCRPHPCLAHLSLQVEFRSLSEEGFAIAITFLGSLALRNTMNDLLIDMSGVDYRVDRPVRNVTFHRPGPCRDRQACTQRSCFFGKGYEQQVKPLELPSCEQDGAIFTFSGKVLLFFFGT